MWVKPLAAAQVAAPIRKLWDLYKAGSSLQKRSALLSCSTKRCLLMGAPSGQHNKGPRAVPLVDMKSNIVLTGQHKSSL